MLELFTDPILRAPTIGSMLMGLAAGLIGCLVFLQKRTLVGEVLSHAAYPGVVLGMILGALFFPHQEKMISFCILAGAACTSFIGLYCMNWMEKRLRISSDAALCFVLSTFFGVGVLIASYLQKAHALWFRNIQTYLFGQAATMVDGHIILYGALSFGVVAAVILLFRSFEIVHFDRDFARSIGIKCRLIDAVTHFLLVLVIVMGMRSVGVVLMTAMLISPAAASRYLAKNLKTFFLLAGVFGIASGYLGNLLSLYLPRWTKAYELSFPTGPMIVLSGATLCFLTLLLAPRKGLFPRWLRLQRFKGRTQQENILKALYKNETVRKKSYAFFRMRRKGWVREKQLTEKGIKEAEKLIRLHRLWELYLVHLGQGVERVHRSAEEMEHILTPDIERGLQKLLNYPKKDPHHQPIPDGGVR